MNNNSYQFYANNYINEGYCSSGCESGWTLYLDHSSISNGRTINPSFSNKLLKGEEEEEYGEEETEEDEDLSMVSDASSGPPHFHEEEQEETYVNYHLINNDALLRQKKKEKNRHRKVKKPDQSSLLDDTASSSLIQFSTSTTKKTTFGHPPLMEDYSQGYSTTQFQVRPHEHQDDQHYNYFQPLLISGEAISSNDTLPYFGDVAG